MTGRLAALSFALAVLGAGPACAGSLTPDLFENVLGLGRTSTADDAVKLLGPYSTTDGTSFVWNGNGGPWLEFVPGASLHIDCETAPSLDPSSQIGMICATLDADQRAQLLSGFVPMMGNEWMSAHIGIFLTDRTLIGIFWN